MPMHKTQWLRAAKAGTTVDERQIDALHIQQMAETYAIDTYGGIVNIEHLISLYPDSYFSAQGEIEDVKAEKIDGEYYLFVKLTISDLLVKLNKERKKVHLSIEYYKKFADTGKAYIVGVAFCDRPASLGTERTKFSTNDEQHGPKLFSQTLELSGQDFMDSLSITPETSAPNVALATPDTPTTQTLTNQPSPTTVSADPTPTAPAQNTATAAEAEVVSAEMAKLTGAEGAFGKIQTQLTAITEQLTQLTTTLSQQPSTAYTPRQQATGDDGGTYQTDC